MIVVGGENLFDFIQTDINGSDLSYRAMPGGSPYNCAMAIGKQAVDVGYLTPISTDSLGEILAKTLVKFGVDLLAPRSKEPTSLAMVALQNAVPSYQFYREGTADRAITMEMLMTSIPDGTKVFYVGSLALASGPDADVWADFYCAMHAKGIFTALDPNIRPDFIHDRTAYLTRLDRVLMETDLLKLSDEDLDWLFPDETIADAAPKLMQRTSAKLLVVTMGSEGALAFTNKHNVAVKSMYVKTFRDTVGAGDVFMATLLAQLSRYGILTPNTLINMNAKEIEDLLQWAACAAALNCEESGCFPPSLEKLQAARFR